VKYWLDLFSILLVVGVPLCLRAYIATKTKGLATTDDLAALASAVGTMRDSFRIREESLRAALEQDVIALEARFRVELPIYREMWDNCLRVSSAHARIRRPNGATPRTGRPSPQQAYESFRAAFEHMQSSVRRFDPFCASEVTVAILGATLPARWMTATENEYLDADHAREIEWRSHHVVVAVDLLKTNIRDRLRADVSAVARLVPRPEARIAKD